MVIHNPRALYNKMKESIQAPQPAQTKNSREISTGKSLEQIGKLVFNGELKIKSAALYEMNKQLRIGWQHKLPGFPGKRGAYTIAGYNYLLWRFSDRKTRSFTGSAAKLAAVARKYLAAEVAERQIVRARQRATALPVQFSIPWRSGIWKPIATNYRGTKIRNIIATSRRDLIMFAALAEIVKETQKATFENKSWRGISGVFELRRFWKLCHTWSDNYSDWRAGINLAKILEIKTAAKATAHNYKRQPGDKRKSYKYRDALGEKIARDFAAANISQPRQQGRTIEEELAIADGNFMQSFSSSDTKETAKNSQITALEVFEGQPANIAEAVRAASVSGTLYASFSAEISEIKKAIVETREPLMREDLLIAMKSYTKPSDAKAALDECRALLVA